MSEMTRYRNGWTEEEMETQGLRNYREQGREDALLDGYPGRYTEYHTTEDDYYAHQAEWFCTTPEKLKAARSQGKQEAEEEKQRNPALFYLTALHTMMKNADEWYGDCFNEPKWILERIMRIVNSQLT